MEIPNLQPDPHSRTLFIPVSETFIPVIENPIRLNRRSSSEEHISILNQEQSPSQLPYNPVPEQPTDWCKICDGALTTENVQRLRGCDHTFCQDCFRDYIEMKVSEKQVEDIRCPVFGCDNPVSELTIQRTLPEEKFERFARFKMQSTLEKNMNLRWCPRPDCEGFDIGSPDRSKLVCNLCGFMYCFYCAEAWHGNRKCQTKIDKKLDHWAKSHNAKFCPNCKLRVQKNEGCNHMTCFKCKHQWCWLCGDQYTPQHYDTCPVKRLRRRNPPWTIVVLLLLFPLICPFLMVGGMWYFIEQRINSPPRPGCADAFFRRRWMSYLVLGCLALVLTPMVVSLLILLLFVFLLSEWGRYLSFEKNCLGAIARRRCLWLLISTVLGLALAPLAGMLLILIIVLSPPIAIWFILQKCGIHLIRCCKPNFMKPKVFPGYP